MIRNENFYRSHPPAGFAHRAPGGRNGQPPSNAHCPSCTVVPRRRGNPGFATRPTPPCGWLHGSALDTLTPWRAPSAVHERLPRGPVPRHFFGNTVAKPSISPPAIRRYFDGYGVWEGEIELFSMIDYPHAKLCYAWAERHHGDGAPSLSCATKARGVPPPRSRIRSVARRLARPSRRSPTAPATPKLWCRHEGTNEFDTGPPCSPDAPTVLASADAMVVRSGMKRPPCQP